MTIIASKEKERKEYFRFSKEKFFKINLKLDASNRTQSKNKYKTLESNLSSYFQFHTDSTNKEQRFNPLLPSFFFSKAQWYLHSFPSSFVISRFLVGSRR